MKKFLERLKDLLYDSVDYLIMIGIVGLVVFIIGWRLDLLFANNVDNLAFKDNMVVEEEKANNTPNEEDQIPDQEELNRPEDTTLSIGIPSGSSSDSIADILESKELISNKRDFINKTEELQLAKKLKAGEFEIKSNSSIEEILNILTK